MNSVSVVVLSRFPEIFHGFRKSVNADFVDCKKNVLWDASIDVHSEAFKKEIYSFYKYELWDWQVATWPFQMARNANEAWREDLDNDLCYCGDDTRIIQPDTIKRLQAVAYSKPEIGIVSARVLGNDAKASTAPDFEKSDTLAFVFVYIKREVIDKIGYLDERFEGYGWEDIDYCVRARRAGFQIGYANHVVIKHGVDGNNYQSTFRRVKTQEQIDNEMEANQARFADKWGIKKEDVWQWIGAL